MRGDVPAGAGVLEQLLGLDGPTAHAAASHFAAQAAAHGPAFMGKAMGLRTAVASGSAAEIAGVLTECFGLTDPALATATRTLAPGRA
jgi:hypothetical protein